MLSKIMGFFKIPTQNKLLYNATCVLILDNYYIYSYTGYPRFNLKFFHTVSYFDGDHNL